MSLVLFERRQSSTKSNERPAAEPARTPIPRHPEAEAPDAGYRCREAPDAGEGRVALLEHEFTHGRSRS
jgi:hypothetical protein